MKKEDLMIGDWVDVYHELPDESGFYKPLQVTGIHQNDGICFGDSIIESPWNDPEEFEEELKPIPLTSEILEKNAFLKVEAIEYPSHSVGISFLYRNTPEGLRIFVQNACVGGPTCTMIKTCKYVHEVQHMIKMCDIERAFVL